MTSPPSNPVRTISLDPASKAEAEILQNLFQLYAHDFSEMVQLELNPLGRFDVGPVERFWSDARYSPFFVRAGGKLAGFAIAHRGSRVSNAPGVMDVAEFFVVRGERRQGVGTQAALALLSAFESPWEIRVRRTNAPARAFWLRAAETWTRAPVRAEPFTAAGVDWDVIAARPASPFRD